MKWPLFWKLLLESFAREAVKIKPEPVKLKNLHCYKPLPGNSW
jgi:hypothetical protein